MMSLTCQAPKHKSHLVKLTILDKRIPSRVVLYSEDLSTRASVAMAMIFKSLQACSNQCSERVRYEVARNERPTRYCTRINETARVT